MINANSAEILLVEDNQQHVELMLRALKKHQLADHVFVVHDGAKALDFVFPTEAYSHRKIEDTPKVILLDLKLPKVDGLEVLRRIKSNEKTKPIPVVVLTTSNDDRDILKSYQLGANSYMVKPVNAGNFVQMVSQVGRYWMLLNTPPG
ncbi:response regulator [candidate division KSB1 bacterium]|nr:response regulator [candidate division KSB1 bacterium]NIR70767.1 response regulator [candidate division KSB1 bacterium]NIS23220.1 response regulator [candidate division KSB1 bacterium]NIT70080.1 response regulator [candidate division KSB1 bacterium]NIU23717.1 response regulator [candidate division KSB1 bacterium]